MRFRADIKSSKKIALRMKRNKERLIKSEPEGNPWREDDLASVRLRLPVARAYRDDMERVVRSTSQIPVTSDKVIGSFKTHLKHLKECVRITGLDRVVEHHLNGAIDLIPLQSEIIDT